MLIVVKGRPITASHHPLMENVSKIIITKPSKVLKRIISHDVTGTIIGKGPRALPTLFDVVENHYLKAKQ